MQQWPIERLKPYLRNARTHSPEQVDQLAASIREWGFTIPILATPEGVIIAGHGRVMAAQRLGMAKVPVMVAAGWTDAQIRAYVLADNRLAQNAGWDHKLLDLELVDLSAAGFDMMLAGFNEEELAKAMGSVRPADRDPDAAPAVEVVPISRPGDIWVLGAHRIGCGDSTDNGAVEALLAGDKPKLMVTDPPYGVEYDPSWRSRAGVNLNAAKLGVVRNDDRADWREAWALFLGDVAYVWHAGRFASSVQASLEAANFNIRAQIIWAKDRLVLSRGHYHWQHEPCWYAVREKGTGHWHGDRSQTTLWTIPARDDSGHGHSTQKPVECMRRPIENNSKPGDFVYEPFSGSGTTIIAAEMTGRKAIAMELDPLYVDLAVRRWQEFTGNDATLLIDGQTFAQVSNGRAQAEADAA